MRTLLPLLLLALLSTFAQAQPGSVFIEDLTWPELQDAMANGKTAAIYYADRTEQNDPHIALGKHNFIAPYVSGRIAEELGPMTNPLSPPWPRRKANLSSGCKKTPRRCAKAALISTAQFGITQQPRIEILMCAASGAGK